jgi:hypothetical protein
MTSASALPVQLLRQAESLIDRVPHGCRLTGSYLSVTSGWPIIRFLERGFECYLVAKAMPIFAGATLLAFNCSIETFRFE